MCKRITFLIFCIFFSCAAAANDVFHLRTQTHESVVTDTHVPEPPPYIYTQPEHVTLTTSSGIQLPALFYDRGSSIALLAAQGFQAPKEAMRTHAKIFNEYDVLLFDYCWNRQQCSSSSNTLSKAQPVQHFLLDKEEEMRTALNFLQQRKKYERIVGLGICYSVFLLAKIQADETKKKGRGPFTHLVLDSSWPDLKSLAYGLMHDPFVYCNPQEGGAPRIVKEITKFPLIKYPLIMGLFTFLTNASTTEHIQHVKIPTLFIQGTYDRAVPAHDFEKVWCACAAPYKAALLTPYGHVNNIKNEKMYKYVVEHFVAASTTGELHKQ